MKNAVKLFTYFTLVFIILHLASALFSGVIATLVRVVAFALPAFAGYTASRRLKKEREEIAGVAERESTLLSLDGGSAAKLLTLLFPVIAIVFLISYLTSLLLGAIGADSTGVEDAPLIEMLLLHALMPAVLEELTFRYMPMKLLAPYSRRWCVILSSLYFALIHMNAFQLPYALAAGFIFIVVDIACDSIWPSFLLHFLNNAVSVLWIKYSGDPGFALWFVITLVALALLSLIPIVIRRKSYLADLKAALEDGEPLTERSAPMILVFLCLAMTVINLAM